MKVHLRYISVIILTLVISSCLNTSLKAQAKPIVEKNGRFYQYNDRLTATELDSIFRSNEEAYNLFKSSQGNLTIGYLSAISGSAIALGSFISDIKGEEIGPNPIPLLIGGSLQAVGIVLIVKGISKRKRAASVYNAGLTNSNTYRPELELIIRSSEMGVRITF